MAMTKTRYFEKKSLKYHPHTVGPLPGRFSLKNVMSIVPAGLLFPGSKLVILGTNIVILATKIKHFHQFPTSCPLHFGKKIQTCKALSLINCKSWGAGIFKRLLSVSPLLARAVTVLSVLFSWELHRKILLWQKLPKLPLPLYWRAFLVN